MNTNIYSIIFEVTGRNHSGADTGILFLMQGKTSLIRSAGFSGGLHAPIQARPIPTGTYTIHLTMRQVVTGYPCPGDSEASGMHQFYGIEKIDTPEWQAEWGHYRAHLNERQPGMAQGFHGNFLRGKLRDHDYTHGCICERSEVILKRLWTLDGPQIVPLHVTR